MPTRFLIIRLSSLGDVILTTPVFENVVRAVPDAELHFVTRPAYVPLFEHHDPRLHVHPYDTEQPLEEFIATLNGLRPDRILDLHVNVHSIKLIRHFKKIRQARVRKHYRRRVRMVKKHLFDGMPLSAVDTYNEGAARFGIAPLTRQPRLILADRDRESLSGDEDWVQRDASIPTLGIGWGARWPTKRVPRELWEPILRKLSERGDLNTVLIGETGDAWAIEKFLLANKNLKAIKLLGRPLRTVLAALEASDVFLTGDSGLMHAAAALGRPVVALFGPTHPALGFSPIGPDTEVFHADTKCSPCDRHGRKPCYREKLFCFLELDPERVAAAVAQRLWRT